eukprot:3398740-Amphidinium_carterae.1
MQEVDEDVARHAAADPHRQRKARHRKTPERHSVHLFPYNARGGANKNITLQFQICFLKITVPS